MFGLFGKKEEVKPVNPVEPSVLEVGKTITFKDPKTGETIYQIALSPENRKLVMDAMQENGVLGQRFMQASRNRILIEQQVLTIHNEIAISEKKINDTITKVRDEMKLDKRWGFNLQLGILERRDPPGM